MTSEKILKFRSAKELQRTIDAYFEACHEDDEPVTITGLALALNVSRETLRDYSADDAFYALIKQAKLRVQHAYEKRLIKRGNTGDVFALKNFGWSEKTDAGKNIDLKTALVAFSDEKNEETENRKEIIFEYKNDDG